EFIGGSLEFNPKNNKISASFYRIARDKYSTARFKKNIPIDVEKDNIDMLSVSAHKFNAPKGIGFLYIKKGINIENLMFGGQQEKGHRPGTENAAFIIGMDVAQKIAISEMAERNEKEIKIRDHMIDRILKEIPYTRLNGDKIKRVPNNVNVSIRFIEGESLLLSLEEVGICASTGSACASGSLDPSHVLLAIGLPHEIAHGSLRLTINHETTMEDADYIVDNLKKVVENLRKMSPLYEDYIRSTK
ncbi:MAG: aminotransferase class V-fold PLP-dependent enzyme, partial [Lachnospiraceae bacterium]|nr:aminotransferase class V-fold PLP-dependent enzyme [Lachnospiraceae bacterium]